jgi:hypothetical protein
MAFNKTLKSDRILQSRRFTQDKNPDSSEVFTRVLDLNASEIYAQQNLIPTTSLPFSASDQNGYYFTSTGQISTTATGGDILRYRYRQRLTPSNTYNDGEGTTQNTWFFLDTYAGDTGVSPGILQATQGANFISPKYAPTQGNNAEQNPPGYQVILTQGGVLIDSALYTFDYKTGVLEFNGQSGLTNSSDIRLTAYQYVGRTLASDQTQGYSGSFSGSFQGDGNGLTNIPASGIVGLNLTQIATTDTTASVSSGTDSFKLVNNGNTLFTIDNTGKITSSNSASFKDTQVTGSLLVTQNLTVLGTASFTQVTSSQIIVGASTITLNTDDPVIRYGGLIVVDSGSFGIDSTGSLLWDSERNHWIYGNPSGYDGGGIMSGPRNTAGLGNETYPTHYAVLRGQGGDHLEDSNIYSTGSNVTINKMATGSLAGVEILGDLEVTGSVRITAGISGSFSGSFQGNGAGLTNLPASSIIGLNLTQIADNFVTASVSAGGGNTFTVTSGGSPLFAVNGTGGIRTYAPSTIQGASISGSTILSGSTSILGPTNINGLTTVTSSITLSTPLPLAVTSSTIEGNYVLLVSQSAWFHNHNVGVPKSNAWKDATLAGSYFENFDHNTNVSEILRFVAGLLSSSAPSPTPNSRTYNTVTANETNLGSTATVSVLSDQRLSLGYTSSAQISQAFKDTVRYGITKGWSAVGTEGNGEGTQPWKQAGAAYYENFSTYNYTFTSNASSGTGGNGSDFFGLGAFVPTEQDFKVQLIGSMSFSDTASITTPNASTGLLTQTKTLDFSRTRGATTGLDGNGLGLATIYTANPAVIPNTFQDARFSGTGGTPFLTRSFGTSLVAANTVSSSGYYNFYGMQAGVTSGSSTSYIFKTTSNISRLWLPITAIQTSMSATPATITATGTVVVSSSLAPSRSLSGAPYLTAGTSTWTYSTTASGIFDPAYRADTVFNQTVTENITGTVTITSNTVVLDANGITTSGKVYDAAGNVKNSGLPRINDVIRSTANVTHTIASEDSNIAQTGIGTINFNLATSGVSYNASSTPLDSRDIPYYQSGSYVQPITSGTLAIYGQVQGYDGGTYSLSSGNLVVNFTGESRRLQFTDKLLSGSYALGDAWSTAFGLYNLGTSDLQIKPGFLVKPTGSGGYGYWLNDPDTSATAPNLKKKYAAFGFTRNTTGNQPNITMTLAGNTTLSAWTVENPNTVSILIIPQSVLATVTQASGIDPVAAATTTAIGAGTGTNPFSRTLTVLANSNSQKTNPFIVDFPTSPNPFPLNGSYQNFVVLVRYIGNPVPLTSITLAVS